MIAMIFEVWPKSEHRQDYLDTAAVLRPLLAGIEGFISIERFERLSEPGKLLSLGFFRDEQTFGMTDRAQAPTDSPAVHG
jgi:heme-degrading monooxygenase HmoA